MTLKKGEYYKVIGGYFGAVWDGRKWLRFDCDGCLFAAGIVHPADRRQGHATPKAIEAYESGPVVYRHDAKLHGDWLREGKPIRAKMVTIRK